MNNLNIALRELDEEWLHSLAVNEDTPCFEVSKGFLRWEQRVIYGKKSVSAKVLKVVAIAAALLILFSVIALSTTKGREFVMQFFKESAVYSLQAEQSEDVYELKVEYLPEGFILIDTYEDDMVKYYFYTNKAKRFAIQKNSLRTTADFDFNGKNIEIIDIEGVEYVVSSNEEYCSVVWNRNNYFYQVTGVIDKQEALKVAMGVQ